MLDYDDARPVRLQPLVQMHLGRHGWAQLHMLADLRGHPARLEVLYLLRWALARSLAGDNPDLTPAQFATLFDSADGELVEESTAA